MTNNTDHPQVMVLPPLVFLGYLIGAFLMNWAIPFPIPWTFALRIVGGIAAIVGFLLGGSAFSQMTKAHTSPDPHQPSTALVIEGPYRFTRNPIYLGFLLIYLGLSLLGGTLWGVIAAPFLIWTVNHAVIHFEEKYLVEKFGESYRQYMSRVRQWI
jgi:protein-S-isoprenylcysteine O-methyltransferase Ste14